MIQRISVLAFMCLGASPLAAAPATEEEAARLSAVFQEYLGGMDGVVTVTPSGESYEAVFDFAPLLDLFKFEGAVASVTPLRATLTDQGNGKWGVEGKESFAVAVSVPDLLELRIDADTMVWSGTYDEALSAFEASQGELTGMRVFEVIRQAGGSETRVEYSIANIGYESSATAATGGGVDQNVNYSATGFSETISIPAGPDTPMPMDIRVTAESYTAASVAKGTRTTELLGIWKWFVAHPSEEAIKSDVEGLKTVIATALPFWNALSAESELKKVAVATPFGAGSADSLRVEIDLSGVSSDGRLRERIEVRGLQLPTEIMPSWVPPLLPSDVTIDVAGHDFDLAAPARILLDELKLGEEPAAGFEARLAEALLPKGDVTITLAPGGFSNSAFEVDFRGVMTVGPISLPAGSATIGLSGDEALLAALNAAPEDVSSGAVPALLMARGMAKTDGGRLSWDIEFDALGKIIVNGNDLSAMMGAQ